MASVAIPDPRRYCIEQYEKYLISARKICPSEDARKLFIRCNMLIQSWQLDKYKVLASKMPDFETATDEDKTWYFLAYDQISKIMLRTTETKPLDAILDPKTFKLIRVVRPEQLQPRHPEKKPDEPDVPDVSKPAPTEDVPDDLKALMDW
jgi:hypothetical protein